MMTELVQGNDRPQELGNPKFDDHGGKTCGLLLHMLRNYFATGRYFVLDSGFCVFRGIAKLKKREMFCWSTD